MQSKTLGICDRCGFEFKLAKLKRQVVAKKPTAILVCRSCMDEDQPQWFGPLIRPADPAPIRDARPDTQEIYAYSGFGFYPVGGPGTWASTGVPYDFDLLDDLVVNGACFDSIVTEDGRLIITESSALIDTEMSCLDVLVQEDWFSLLTEDSLFLGVE